MYTGCNAVTKNKLKIIAVWSDTETIVKSSQAIADRYSVRKKIHRPRPDIILKQN